MGDKEILAELKRCYEYLQDIIDNADKAQLKSVKELETAQEIMARKYEEVYNKIKEENDVALYYEEDVMICDVIYGAYEKDGDPLTEADMDWQKWWRDDSFIREF